MGTRRKSCWVGVSVVAGLLGCSAHPNDQNPGQSDGAAGLGGTGAGGATGASGAAGSGEAGNGGAAGAAPGADAAGAVDGGAAEAPLDAGADTAGDAPASWTPAALGSKLTLWLDDTAGLSMSGNGVKWTDSSAQQLPGAGSLLAVDPSAINHLPALQFPQTPPMVNASSAGKLFISSRTLAPLAIAVVVKMSPSGGVVWRQESFPPATFFQLKVYGQGSPMAGNYEVSYGGVSSTANVQTLATTGGAFDDDQFHIVIVRATGAGIAMGLELTVDDGPPVTAAATQPSGMQGDMYLGGGISATTIVGEIAEVVGWGTNYTGPGLLSDDDLAHLHAYLRAKFAL
jgi:hypothetical protein